MTKILKLTIIASFLTSCGVSLEKYEASKTEATLLQSKVDSLQNVINQLQRTPATLISEAQIQLKTGEYVDAKETLERIIKHSITPQQKKIVATLVSKINLKLEDIGYSKVVSSKDVEPFNDFI